MNHKIIVSTGMICLDAVQHNGGYWLMAGGSAINPLIILKHWGWEVYPTGKIGRDHAADALFYDIHQFEINSLFLFQDDDMHTPVYMMTSSSNGHCFHKECLGCGFTLPVFTPVSLEKMNNVIAQLPNRVDVCLIERLSTPALDLVRSCKERGAIIFFEPNRIEDETLLTPMLAMTDIVKYSSERIPLLNRIESKTPYFSVRIEIQTLAEQGIRYRTAADCYETWNHLPPVVCDNFIDAAGAGDWTTARLLHDLNSFDSLDMVIADEQLMRSVIQQAQIEASINCGYKAARGRMYHTPPALIQNVCSLHT